MALPRHALIGNSIASIKPTARIEVEDANVEEKRSFVGLCACLFSLSSGNLIFASRLQVGLAGFFFSLVRLGEKEMVRGLCEVVQRTRRDFLKTIYGGGQNGKGVRT
jgi:hypothetical protein